MTCYTAIENEYACSVDPWIMRKWELGPLTPTPLKICYNFRLYSQPFASADSTCCRWKNSIFIRICKSAAENLRLGICGWECENTVFNLRLVESADVKPADTKGQLYLLKKPAYKWTCIVQTVLFMGQLHSILLVSSTSLWRRYSEYFYFHLILRKLMDK